MRAAAIKGLITVRSSFGHGETLVRLETAIRANAMSVVARFEHGSEALERTCQASDGTTLLMFENHERQAAMVKALQLITLEMPFRVLAWQDTAGQTFISYPDFRWLAKRYGVPREDVCLFTDAAVLIDGIARKAGSPP